MNSKYKSISQILNEMTNEMPFHLSENLVPYITEAMELYAKECCKKSFENLAETLQISYDPYLKSPYYIKKTDITNSENIKLA